MPKWLKWSISLVFTTVLLIVLGIVGWTHSVIKANEIPSLELANEYVRIIVNNNPHEETGRFSIGTTGGDPERIGDENQHLIYGGREPWTSFTTIQIDRENWVFGNPTQRRAGISGNYGEMIQAPTLVDNGILSIWRLGPVEVTQKLSLTRSSTTGLMDTVKIEYELTNLDSISHRVALRLVLDTMLGPNDGAPFRFGEREVLTDTALYGGDIPDFWLAFDSLSDPRVIAQGTLRGGDITPPDRVFFSNWGSIADSLFDFNFVPGRDFTRKGEFELDSAIALYWDVATIGADETVTYVTHYGLGGVTISHGELSIGLNAPRTIPQDRVFSIFGLFESGNESEIKDVNVKLELPYGLELVEEQGNTASRYLGDIAVGETKPITWKVRPTGDYIGNVAYKVVAEAANCESNSAKREIEILKPADIQITLKSDLNFKTENEQLASFIKVPALIKNVGGAPAYRLEVTMINSDFNLARGEIAKKYIAVLESEAEYLIEWAIDPQNDGGILEYSVTVVGHEDEKIKKSERSYIIIPRLKPRVWIGEPQAYLDNEIQVGEYFSLPIWATNINDFRGATLDLSFDPELVEIVGGYFDITSGTLFIDDISKQLLNWNSFPKVNNLSGQITEIWGDRDVDNGLNLGFGTLVNIRFYAKKAGDLAIEIDQIKLYDSKLNPIKFEYDTIKTITIK